MEENKKINRDEKAPKALQFIVAGEDGREWGRMYATPKVFKTGSVGFYTNGKMVNPFNTERRYQIGITVTLIGSK
ncbi:MAG: hypothetical protein LBD24_07625 [Spirochaetaceae bacterium]|jgi:hypothetical protein|nr:hypothetical protein [Spirochaetaceae bacterium]